MVKYGQDPADFKQDVLTRKAVGLVNRRAPRAQPFFLWLTYTAPHVGGLRTRTRRATAAAAKPAPRHAHAFDSEPLPRPPNFNEADVSDKPAAIRNLPRMNATQIANIQRKYRCELESLLSVDEGVQEGRRCAEGERASSATRCSSSPPTTASSTASTGSPGTRGTSTRSRSGCRSRCAGRASRGGERRRPRDQRRPGADDRRRGEREPRPGHGRALADPGRPERPASSGGASS